MDNNVSIVAMVAAAVVVVLYIFRDKLKSFSINANEKGIKAELKTELPARAAAAGESRGATVEDSKAGGSIWADATGGGAAVRRSEAVGDITATSRQRGDPAHPK
jgi:hypothetical protein